MSGNPDTLGAAAWLASATPWKKQAFKGWLGL